MIQTPPLPRYVQIRQVLHERIMQGDLQPGEKLPSEDQLAVEFGVSRMTMRKGLDDLLEAGLIFRRHGLGTFVSNTTVQRDHTRLTDFFADRADGRVPSARLLKRELLPAPPKIAKALDLPAGEPLLRLATLRTVDKTPITYHDAYLPARHFPELLEADVAKLGLEHQHVWQLIEEQGYVVGKVVERLEAQIASAEIGSWLRIKPGSPVLYGERVLYSDDGMALKYADCYNRGDSFSLTVVLGK